MSTATRGHASKLSYVSGTNETFVAQITSIDGLNIESDDIDISNMDSPSRYREFIAGMINAGEASIELVYTKAQHAALQPKVGAEPQTWEIEFSDKTSTAVTAVGSVLAFSGYLKSLGVSTDFESDVRSTATIKATGVPTFTPSA